MKKGLLSLLAIIFAFTTVHAATLLHEPFSQSVGSSLTTAVFDASNTSAWMHTTSWGTAAPPNTIKVTDGNMTMTNNGYMASGSTTSNRLTLGYGNSARYAFHNFTSQKSGSVFLAAIVNVAELRDYTGSTIDNYADRYGGYLFCLGNGTAGTQQTARVYTRTAMENGKAVGFYLGVGKLNESVGKPNDPNYKWEDGNVLFDTDHVYQAGVDYLIVVEYQFVSGTYNDKINLYVNPSKSRQEATIKEFTNTKKTDIDAISLVGIAEGNAQQTKVYIDELKVATDWASLFPGEETNPDPYINVTPETVNLTDGIMEVGQTYSTTITLKGAYLADNTVTLVNDRPDEVTLSKTTFTKAEIESGAQVTITAKPNKIALGQTLRLTISCGKLEQVLKISWNANRLIECPTVAALNEAFALGTGEQILNVKFTGEALVTYSFRYGKTPMLYNLVVLQDATGACVISRDSVYFDGKTDQMAVGNKVTGMQLTDGANCLLTNDSIAQPDFKVNSTGNPVIPAVISASEMAQHHFELVTINKTTFQPAEGVTTFDVSLQNVKNDSHGWGKCAKVNATASGTTFVTSVTNSVDDNGAHICDLIGQAIPTNAVNATGLVWGDAELRIRNKSDLVEIVTVTLNCNPAQGSVTGGGEVEAGTSVTISATPKDHFRFVQWSDGVKTATREITVVENVTLTAEFEAINFTVTVNCNAEQGSVTGGGTFQEGSTVTLTATPKDHFRFVQWSDGVKTATRQITVVEDVTLTAVFEAINFTVTVNCNAEQGSVTGGGTFQEGSTVTLKATPNDHFRFVQWSDGVKTATREITVTENVTLTAVFEAINFTVTVSCEAEQGSVIGGGTFQEGSTVTLKATPNDHFRFVQWSDGVKTATREITVVENVTLTAVFEAINFTVTVTCNEEQGSVTGGGNFQEGSTVTLTATPKEHFRFVQWSDGVKTATREITVVENVTLTAAFEAINFTVTVNCNEEQGSVIGGGTFQEGSTVTLTATPKDHFRFVQWSDGDINAERTIILTSDTTLTAEFEAINFTITVSCNAEQGSVTGGGTFQEGSTVTLTATPKDHFRFVQWSDGVKTATRQITVVEDVTLTAVFEAINFTITVNCNEEQGSVTGGGTFQEGSTVMLTATPKDHFRFVQWSDGVKTATRQVTVNSNITLTAEFEAINFTVTLSCNAEQGSVTGGGTFQEGSTVTLTATPNDHFRFVQWSDGDINAERTIILTSDTTLTAEFEAINFTVTVNCNEDQGSVTGSGTFQEGSTVTLTATAKDHFRFVQWSDGDINAERTIILTSDTTLTAEFEAIMFTVTVEWNAAMGSVIGAGTFQEGTVIELTASAIGGFSFFQWSDGNTDNPRTITVDGDLSLTAIFVQDKPTTIDQTTSTISVKKVMRDGHILIIRNDDAYDLTGRKQ